MDECDLETDVMNQAHKIILIGFSAFEQATFESFFRLAARRPPGYQLVQDATQAELAVVNADDAATMQAIRANKPTPQIMLIGNSDSGTGWALQKRPLNLMKVLGTVEQLLSVGNASAQASVPRAMAPTVPAALAEQADRGNPAAVAKTGFSRSRAGITEPAPLLPKAVESTAHSAVRISRQAGKPSFGHSRGDASGNEMMLGAESTLPPRMETNVDHILVVDDSDIALKFMRNRLSRFGFSTDLVNSGEEALARLNVRPYKFVFLDVMMEGLDGYQTCRAIKQRKYSDGKPPVVIMLTSRGGTIDKIRGTLAGCDAYLTKPLNERDLIAVLAKHDRSVARGFQQTNFGSSSKSGYGEPTAGR
jgi:two-component system, cell cycle response regulator